MSLFLFLLFVDVVVDEVDMYVVVSHALSTVFVSV